VTVTLLVPGLSENDPAPAADTVSGNDAVASVLPELPVIVTV